MTESGEPSGDGERALIAESIAPSNGERRAPIDESDEPGRFGAAI